MWAQENAFDALIVLYYVRHLKFSTYLEKRWNSAAMYFFWMTRWIHLNRRKGASIYSDLLPMTEVLKENGMTKYKIQIVQRWQSTKYRFYILASSAWNFDLNLHYWLSLLPDQSLDLNLSIYFYDVFMWLRWHPGWTEGGGLERLNSIYDFTPTQCHGREKI